MRVGQARKRDANEMAIVGMLEVHGAAVIRLSGAGVPDLLVLYRGRLYLLEIKRATGKQTPAQIRRQMEGWPVYVARTADEALAAIGVN